MDRNDLLVAARAEFVRAFTEALDASVRQAEAHLFIKADTATSSADQRRYLDARIFIQNSTAVVRQQVLANLDRLLSRSFQTAYNTFRPSFSAAFNSNTLSLVETTAFEGELRIDDFTKRFRDESEDQLRDLNIRIALLFEQEDISERENPFRPYLISRSIASAIEGMELPMEEVSALTVQLSEGMLGRVSPIYESLNALLARHGLAAQLQLKIKKLPTSLSMPGVNADGPATVSPMSTESESLYAPRTGPNSVMGAMPQGQPRADSVSKVDQLMERVLQAGQPAGPAEEPVSPAPRSPWLGGIQAAGQVLRDFFSGPSMPEPAAYADDELHFAENQPFPRPEVTRLAHSIQEMQLSQTPSAAEMLGDDGRVRNLILEERAHLTEMAHDSNEQMIIDIVAMLFEFILRDAHVPAEVRAQLGRLQFLVLKIALLDPELFSKEYHDVRLLVNRIGSISLGLQQLDPSGERISAEICRIVETLLADETQGVALFGKMLDELDAFVARELRAADSQVDLAAQAVEKAENRTLQFARISAMIANALQAFRVDTYLHEFLVSDWSRVIERAGRDHEAQARRFRTLVPDLVWSIAPKTTLEDRRQLLGMIPDLIDGLSSGLKLIAWSEADGQVLMNWLVDAHRHALRAGHTEMPVPPLAALRDCFADFIGNPEAQLDVQIEHFPLDRHILNEAIGELEFDLNMIDQMIGLDSPTELEFEEQGDEVLDRLRAGVMIEVDLTGSRARGRLNWVGGQGSMLILELDGHDQPSVLSLRAFLRLLKRGRASFIEDAPLFERAVKALLETADQIDKP